MYSNMQYSNQPMTSYPMNSSYPNSNSNQPQDERFIGAAALPFLLGGVTGAALAPAFWNRPYPTPYPVYPTPYPTPYPAPCYAPYCRY